jgi:uncharacterized protein YodC (DUF2158 family)
MGNVKVGDVVRLKSAEEPTMTVKKVFDTNADEWECQWFLGGELKEGVFPAASLEKILPKGGKARISVGPNI